MSWGDSDEDEFHGLSNDALADRTKMICEKYNTPSFNQWEIGENLKKKGFTLPNISIPLPLGETYMDTYYVLTEMKEKMHDMGYKYAIIIAHEIHLPRVQLTARSMGIIESHVHPVYDSEIPYDPKSKHLQTTRKWIARPYEYCATKWYMATGKINIAC